MESGTLQKIQHLVKSGNILISNHGYDELAEDAIFVRDVIQSVYDAVVVEDYPNFKKGPCVLVLQKDRNEEPLHVVWGIPKGKEEPAVVVTAYRPDPKLWHNDFMRRRT